MLSFGRNLCPLSPPDNYLQVGYGPVVLYHRSTRDDVSTDGLSGQYYRSVTSGFMSTHFRRWISPAQWVSRPTVLATHPAAGLTRTPDMHSGPVEEARAATFRYIDAYWTWPLGRLVLLAVWRHVVR